jgi:glutathione S-transferase
MTEIVFHHYPQSPVAEKVRVVFGIKQLRWRSVEIPRIPPKPDLMPLTGGYRRTPVLQVGADIYCDSQCILRELERRFPEPSLFPEGGLGLAWGVGRWTDGTMFTQAISIVLGASLADLPPEFAADRGRLYFGVDFDLQAQARDVPHTLAQLRAQLAWADDQLSEGRAFMLGTEPGLADASLYYIVWFLRGRYAGGPALLQEFEHLLAWEQRVCALGHGDSAALSSSDALRIAREATVHTQRTADPLDAQGLEPGMQVGIQPADDGGDPQVTGELLVVGRDVVAIVRDDERVGRVAIHFPRVGYRVERL